ncbi:MAG: hypothetical protein U9M95_06575 [Candidatus Altiarchaeota archaeon]|nr:hypothetical protein [Candidatus Altiarchaeota archaeon]
MLADTTGSPGEGGQITVSKDLVKALSLKNKDKVLVEYNETTKEIKVTKL